ncbi:MAG: shikimate kinase [Armatimonadetes bacterium]|nr:shikimate kinase [Armatimonadota bacterium]
MARIVLLGMMGSGKSTVGRALAARLEVPFRDTDQLLEYRLGRHIPQIFQLYGEEAFRSHETSVLRSLDPIEAVTATGGGIVLREENWPELRRLGTTVFLNAYPEVLIKRLDQSSRKRPLLAQENWESKLTELLEKRLPLYRQADVTVDVKDEEIESVVEEIVKCLNL